MSDRPILFSAPMVRALLAGTKTQTRRAVAHPGLKDLSYIVDCGDGWWGDEEGELQARCPYGQPGDRLWVRETWGYFGGDEYLYQKEIGSVGYRASQIDGLDHVPGGRWRPSIHMPRWASRITLEITGVRVERLQDITADDAMAEGIVRLPDGGYAADTDGRHYHAASAWYSYGSLWESINGHGSWEANPWVWVVEFKRVKP